MNLWARLLSTLFLLGLAALLTWSVSGATFAVAVFAAGLLIVLLTHYLHIGLLRRWLRNPVPEAAPRAWGLWDDLFAEFYRLLRLQRQSESRLNATLEEFRRAAAAMPDGMVILGTQGRIEWCNPAAEDHFGLDSRRDTGQSITNLVRQPQFMEYLAGKSDGEPLLLRLSRGVELVLSVQLVPYGDGQKLVISRDVTKLEQVETIRRDFIANVSHELRTPLTVLGGFLETLADAGEESSGLLRRSLPLMLDQSQRMRRLVEDLLTLSRLESSQNPLREEPVNVPALVRAQHHDALALSSGRHRILLDLSTGDWLTGSEEELRSAFNNLITNAVRYTPEGGEITIAWRRLGGEMAFSVRDTGIGIEAQHLPRLTERFYRVDRSRSRETGGTGLGLAIVKHVTNRHQARFEVTSEPGRGSTFSVLFPAGRQLAPDREPLARSA